MDKTQDKIMFKVDNGTRLDTIFNNVLSSFGTAEQTKGYIPMVSFQSIFKGTYKGQSKYKIVMNVNFRKLKDYSAVKNYTDVISKNTDNTDILGSEDNRQAFIKDIKDKGWFIRKYEYGRSGKDISVQNVILNENNSWYFEANKMNENAILRNDDNKKDTDSEKEANSENKDSYNYGTVRDINELYDSLSIEQKLDYLSRCRTIPIKCNTVSKQSQDSNNNVEGLQENIRNDLGFMNWRESGFLQELKMDIIGDPVWIYYFTDYNEKNSSLMNFPYIIFEYKPFYKYDSDDNPIFNEIETYISPYQITEVVSTFSGGKFTQNLKGYVPANFYGHDSDKINAKESEKKSNDNENSDIIPQQTTTTQNSTNQNTVVQKIVPTTLGINSSNNAGIDGSSSNGNSAYGNGTDGSKMNIGMNPLNENSDNLITSYEYTTDANAKQELLSRRGFRQVGVQNGTNRGGPSVSVELIGGSL